MGAGINAPWSMGGVQKIAHIAPVASGLLVLTRYLCVNNKMGLHSPVGKYFDHNSSRFNTRFVSTYARPVHCVYFEEAHTCSSHVLAGSDGDGVMVLLVIKAAG